MRSLDSPALAARSFGARAFGWGAWALTRASRRIAPGPQSGKSLSGDRDVEWAWSLGRLRSEPGRVLDLGAGHGLLSLAAAFAGHDVVAVDLEPNAFQFDEPRIEYVTGDFNAMAFGARSFDQVLNCSTIEHFGLGGRYAGATDDPDADIVAMRRLADLLRVDGTMILTLPVGQDDVFAPQHRVYGPERLPRLLESYVVIDESYRAKPSGDRWIEVDKETALAEAGSATYYALGLFVLGVR